MSYSESAKVVNLLAGESLAGDIYELVYIENDGNVGKVIKTTAVTQTPVGVLAESVDAVTGADGRVVPVMLLQGVVPVKAGGSVTAGQLLVADVTPGRVIGVANQAALVADSVAVGVALVSAVDGDIFPMLAQVMTSSTET